MANTPEGTKMVAAKRIGITLEAYLQRQGAGEKWCSKCKSWQPISMFNKDASRGDGLSSRCHGCARVNRPHKTTKGRVSTFKGKHHSEETKRKTSEFHKGKQWNKGKQHTVEARKKVSESRRKSDKVARGEAHHSYKDGKLTERRDQRFSREYKRWRFDVFSRDHFACQKCGDARGGNLVAHHIKPYADYPELRFDVSNGVTLCEGCHKQEHAK